MINIDDLKVVRALNYNGDEKWMFYLDDESAYFFIYNNQVVAEIVLYDEFNYIRIYDFQIKSNLRKQGFGKAVVYKIFDYALKNNKIGICGESTYDAYDFWNALGVEFEENSDDCIDDNYEDDDYSFEEEVLTPFKLENIKTIV